MRPTSILLFICVLVAKASAADEPPVDFKVDVVAWTKEYEEDNKAFSKKYKDKVIEVTGKVWLIKADSDFPNTPPEIWMEGFKKPKQQIGSMAVCSPSKEEATRLQGFRALAKGQEVTFRAKCTKGNVGMGNSVLVKAGPSTATPFTVAGLHKELGTPAGKKKLPGTDAVVRGRIVDIKVTDAFVRWTICDPMKKDGAKVDAQITTISKDLRQEYAKTKIGDTIILIGEIDDFRADPCLLWNARLLKEAPEGVKLPGDKK